MPAPLLWLGAAALSIYATNEANTAYLKRKRVLSRLPGESKHGDLVKVVPENGSIVSCGIYGVLDHSGIWVDGNIYELNGNGLVRCISSNRFLQNRSGDTIYVACCQNHSPLKSRQAANRAVKHLYQVRDYHLIKQNCHRFVAEMLTGKTHSITSFSDLNEFLHEFFGKTIAWHQAKVNFR